MTDNERDLLVEVATVLYRNMDRQDHRADRIRDLAVKVQKEHLDHVREQERLDNLINEIDPLGQG